MEISALGARGSGDRTLVGGNDRFADGQPDAHAPGTVCGNIPGICRPVKDCRYPFGQDADSVIPHMKYNIIFRQKMGRSG